MSHTCPHSSDLILDGHSHAFPDNLAARAIEKLTADAKWQPVKAWHDGTVTGLLASMDEGGVYRTLICSIATRPSQVRRITDWSAAVASDRVVPFASIHPDFDQPEAEIERIASLGLRGLKIHPHYQNCPADDPRVVRMARAAARHNLAVVIHAGYDLAFDRTDIASPRRIRNLFEAVPGMRLMACHLGGWMDWEESLRLLVGQPIYLETSYCFDQCPETLLRRIVEEHPPEYLVFGTDSPWARHSAELAQFKALPLGFKEMRMALWDNGCRFAGIEAFATPEV